MVCFSSSDPASNTLPSPGPPRVCTTGDPNTYGLPASPIPNPDTWSLGYWQAREAEASARDSSQPPSSFLQAVWCTALQAIRTDLSVSTRGKLSGKK